MRKFADLGRWSSYKEPLKRFILNFEGNEDYYLHKQKVGSLNHGVENRRCLSEHVDSMLGILVDEAEMAEKPGRESPPQISSDTARQPDPAKVGAASGGEAAAAIPYASGAVRVRSLRWGVTSMRECAGLAALLDPGFLALVAGGGTGATHHVEVDPWAGVDSAAEGGASCHPPARHAAGGGASPPGLAATAMQIELSAGPLAAFESGPGAEFAAGDERQRRSFNPVTAATLVGKCACLLPPDLVRGRSVLDLGAWHTFSKVGLALVE